MPAAAAAVGFSVCAAAAAEVSARDFIGPASELKSENEAKR